MASSYDISTGSGDIQITGVDSSQSWVGVQVTHDSLDADITLKLKQTLNGSEYVDLPDGSYTLSSAAGSSVLLQSFAFNLSSLYLDIDVGSATTGTLSIYAKSNYSVDFNNGGLSSTDITSLDSATVASGDLMVIADIDDSNNLKNVTAQSVADLASSGGVVPPYNIGNRYTQAINNSSATTSKVDDRLYAMVYEVKEDVTANSIEIYIAGAGAAGSKATLAIYNNTSGDIYPDTLLLNAGEVSIDSTGNKSISISQALTAGIYWVVVFHDSTSNPNFRGVENRSSGYYLGNGSNLNIGYQYLDSTLTYTTSLPDPFPAGATEQALTQISVALVFA